MQRPGKAAFVTEPGRIELRPCEPRPPLPHEVLVRVRYVGLCGTDVELVTGVSPFIADGRQSYPFIVGHEWSGVIEEVGSAVRGRNVGDRVVGHPFITCGTCDRCRAGHANQCRDRSEMGVWGFAPGAAQNSITIPAANTSIVPDAVPLRDAVLAEPAVTVMECIAVTAPTQADRCAVLGSGALAQIAVQLLDPLGCDVTVVARSPQGLAALEAHGCAVMNPEAAMGEEFDVVIDVSGAAYATALLPRICGPGARVALAGVSADTVDGYSLGEFVLRNLTLTGVLHGVLQYEKVLAAMARGDLRPGELVDSIRPFEEFPEAMEDVIAGRRTRPKVLVQVSEGED